MDPLAAQYIHPGDRRKIRRAIQFFKKTGVSIRASEQLSTKDTCELSPNDNLDTDSDVEEGAPKRKELYIEGEGPYDVTVLHPDVPAETLFPSLRTRIYEMIDEGLVEELLHFRSTLPSDYQINYERGVFQCIGLKEFADYVPSDPSSLEKCVDLMDIATRQYARRQLQWIQTKIVPLCTGSIIYHRFNPLLGRPLDPFSVTRSFVASAAPRDCSLVLCDACQVYSQGLKQHKLHMEGYRHRRRIKKLAKEVHVQDIIQILQTSVERRVTAC